MGRGSQELTTNEVLNYQKMKALGNVTEIIRYITLLFCLCSDNLCFKVNHEHIHTGCSCIRQITWLYSPLTAQPGNSRTFLPML